MTAFDCPFIRTPGWSPWETRLGQKMSHIVCHYGKRCVIADTTDWHLSAALARESAELAEKRRVVWGEP